MPPDFAYRELGRELARRIDATERGYRAVCDEIGIAPAAVSRLRAGQPVAAHTVLAVCDWLQGSIYAWRMYEHPGDCSTGNAVKQVEKQSPAQSGGPGSTVVSAWSKAAGGKGGSA